MALFSDDNILNAQDFSVKKCKATIQKTGRLGFSSTAATLMNLSTSSRLLISDCGDNNLAAVVCQDSNDDRGFPLRRAMDYFTADLKGFFDRKGIDYQQTDVTYIYDIVSTEEKYQGNTVFKLTQRIKRRRMQTAHGESDLEGDAESGQA